MRKINKIKKILFEKKITQTDFLKKIDNKISKSRFCMILSDKYLLKEDEKPLVKEALITLGITDKMLSNLTELQ